MKYIYHERERVIIFKMQSFETTYSESIWMWLVLNSIYLIYSILETIIATNYLKKKEKGKKKNKSN